MPTKGFKRSNIIKILGAKKKKKKNFRVKIFSWIMQ